METGSDYIAHINDKTKKIQTIKEHSENTAKLCYHFALSPMKEFMYIMGLFHDLGKFQPSFQQRIHGANIRVEHSTCGALAARELFPNALGMILAYCIAGHHSGIPDAGNKNDLSDESSLYGRLQRKFENFKIYKKELKIPEINQQAFMEFLLRDCGNDVELLVDKFAFFTRYCFSCLVDADSLDTAAFCEEMSYPKMKMNFSVCLEKVNCHLKSFICTTELQKSRHLLQQQVFEKTEQNAEIYLMNMPTGSGKTLTSIKFALERAIKKGKKRIIYIIPYNSIIDQTADTLEKLFQKDAEILRHQSTFSYEDMDDFSEDYRNVAKKAAENWDAPLIITTAVQFFESIYHNNRGKLRKMHHMAECILIFDEAHLMPLEYLQPCLRGIAYITKYLNSEAVFLTATMPDFPKLIKKYALKNSKITYLVEDTSLFSKFQKCNYLYLGEISEEALLHKASIYPSCLIIVNSKKKARRLFEKSIGKTFHLSTYMTGYDRKKVLEQIRRELSLLEKKLEENLFTPDSIPEEERITIISTSLIEAGVDLDVYTVFRELNGLDNILQSGGRCNREGKRANADTFIFSLEEMKQPLEDVQQSIVKGLIKKYPDISCPESVKEYYERLFAIKESILQKNAITQRCHAIDSIPFREYAEQFALITSRTISIVVPRDDKSRELINKLRYTKSTIEAGRKLQLYTCSVYPQELEDLIHQHVIDDFGTGIYCLIHPDYYDEKTGITFDAKDYMI